MKKIGVAVFMLVTFTLCFNKAEAISIVSKPDSSIDEAQSINKALTEAVAEYKSLSKKERKARLKEAKRIYKDYKANKENGSYQTSTVLLTILAVLLPPLAVALYEGEINGRFWLSLLLTLLFILPGIIYAILVVNDVV